MFTSTTGNYISFSKYGKIGINTAPLYSFDAVTYGVNEAKIRLMSDSAVSAGFVLGSSGIIRYDIGALGNGNFYLYQTSSQTYPLFIKTTGSVGINNSNPTALLHLGTSSVAPFGYTAHALTEQSQNGNKEFDGTNEYLTAQGTRYILAKTITHNDTLSFLGAESDTIQEQAITFAGASQGDTQVIPPSPPANAPRTAHFDAFVSAENQITIRMRTSGQIPYFTAVFRITIIKY